MTGTGTWHAPSVGCPSFPELDVVVLEVSSYQLMLPGDLAPSAAVILNLTPDHLERHGTLANYADAKCNVATHMTHADLLLLPSSREDGSEILQEAMSRRRHRCSVGTLGVQPSDVVFVDVGRRRVRMRQPAPGGAAGVEVSLAQLRAMGAHNALNAAAALGLAAHVAGPTACPALEAAVGNLRPPPHRLETFGEIDGVLWVNDSKATNVDAAIVGVCAMDRPSWVLLGGRGKRDGAGALGFGRLAEHLARHRGVVCFGEDGPVIAQELRVSLTWAHERAMPGSSTWRRTRYQEAA